MIGSGSVSMVAVRDDLDLTGSNSFFNERAFRDKACNWDGPITLLEFRNNVLGQQNEQGGANRHQFWPSAFNSGFTGGVADWPDDTSKKCIRLIQTRPSSAQDAWSEARCQGIITESGQYQLTGKTNCRGNTSSGLYGKLAVISASAGYMAGATTTHVNREPVAAGSRDYTSPVFTLSTAQPYISVIFYAVAKGYAQYGASEEHFFQGMKLVKV